MAYSYVQYTGNGSIKTFSVPFTYISKSHIAVKVNGVLKAAGTDYSWDTDSSITFVTAPGTGLTVDIRRASSPSQRIIDFQDGSTLTQDILDADSNQNFFMAQEAIDAVASNIALASDGVFDAVNKRIKNVADPVNAQDAVTKNWAENASSSQVAQATTQANNSASSAAASATSAAASASSATSASGSAATATTKATDSSNSATASAASAAAALTSKNAAATSETNAASSASSASSSATAANTSAVNAATSASGASASASTATTKASDASGSATAASNSASAAATSATNAASSASSASSSATTAATQATNSASSATAAAGSATSASTSATTATTKAGEASTSASNAATSATNAASSATSAATSASDASTSAVSAASSAASAAALLDNFDDRYLGAKASAPSVDNDGNALQLGALYFDSTSGKMRVYTASGWIDASSASVATLATFEFVATSGQTVFTGNDANGASLSYVAPALMVTLNGVRLRPGDDYTATNGTTITLVNAAALNDELVVDAFGSFLVANTVDLSTSQTVAGVKTFSNNSIFNANVGIGTSSPAVVLDVKAPTGKIYLSSTTGTNTTFYAASNTGGSFYMGLDNSAGTEFGAAYAGAIYHSGAYPINFYTGGTQRMRIAGNGAVSIRNSVTSNNALELGNTHTGTGASYGVKFGGGTNSSDYCISGDNAAGTVNLFNFRGNGDFQFNSGYGSAATAYGCRAWVNFGGGYQSTGGQIRASGNVSSVTHYGTGDYQVNFTTAMPDVNYVTICGCREDLASDVYTSNRVTNPRRSTGSVATTSVRVGVADFGYSANNVESVYVSIFR